MRISNVKVESYGGIRDRTFALEPGLNVFYGPNEAGKSSLRSFITMTIFPKAGLKYPVQKGTDRGKVEVELSDGQRLTFEKDGKKSSGLGSELCGIADKEYISIYSISPNELRDVKGLEQGDIRNRFLTIPGGADLPKAYSDIDDRRLELLPETKRSSRCRIAVLMDEEHRKDVAVKQLRHRESGDENYGGLVQRRKELEAMQKAYSEDVRNADAVRTASHRAEGRASDLQKIAELEEREAALAYSENTDTSKLTLLESELERLTTAANKASMKAEEERMKLRGRRPEPFIRNKSQIEYLERQSDEYYYLKQKAAHASAPRAEPEPQRNLPVVAIAGGAIAAGGAVALMFSTVAGAAVIAIGVFVAVFGFRMWKKAPVKSSAPAPRESYSEDNSRIAYVEEKMEDVAADTGIERKGFRSDLQTLTEMLTLSLAYDNAVRASKEAEDERKRAESDLNLFLTGYGGRDRYEQAVKDAAELKDVRSQLKALRESTASVETVQVDSAQAESDYQQAVEKKTEIDTELARIDQALRDITNDTSIEDAITEWTEAGAAVYNACIDWARLMLEKIILDGASTNAYSSHRPDVLTRADAFLSAMTDGRYRIDTDPRATEIGIVDKESGEIKTVKEWSSGLEDQVKLSLKMAVSLSLSKERPPVILDDVLLTSDSGRKGKACEAIRMLSDDIQVLYFTCDRETRDLMERAGARINDL